VPKKQTFRATREKARSVTGSTRNPDEITAPSLPAGKKTYNRKFLMLATGGKNNPTLVIFPKYRIGTGPLTRFGIPRAIKSPGSSDPRPTIAFARS
jgi:hypothetical protein